MPHITIEYVIMVPLLVLQIFLFPLTANWLMNIWVDSRRGLATQDAASHLGSTVQQLYFALNHETISAGKATFSPGLPPFIEDQHYTANATLHMVSPLEPNSSRILEIRLLLAGVGTAAVNSVVLGPNVLWQESTYMSNSTHACVSAEKFTNGTVKLYFGE
jgi:hypothetical protein